MNAHDWVSLKLGLSLEKHVSILENTAFANRYALWLAIVDTGTSMRQFQHIL